MSFGTCTILLLSTVEGGAGVKKERAGQVSLTDPGSPYQRDVQLEDSSTIMSVKLYTMDEFNKLLDGRRFGQERKTSNTGEALPSGRVYKALMLHLIDGVPIREAAFQADRVSTTAIYAALGRLGLRKTRKPKSCCPTCGKPGYVPARRGKSNGKSSRTSASR